MVHRILTHLRHWWREMWLTSTLGSALIPTKLRASLLRASGLSIETGSKVYGRCFFGGPEVQIGRDVAIGHECFFDTQAPIEIRDRTTIGPRCTFVTSTHVIGPSEKRCGPPRSESITISEGCWLGARVTILPGVTVGTGCVLAAGAVVTKDCEPNGLYAGVPARRVRDLP